MDKRVFVQMNGARKVTGVLRGFDPFMNLVLDEAVEETNPSEKSSIGMVVKCSVAGCWFFFFFFLTDMLGEWGNGGMEIWDDILPVWPNCHGCKKAPFPFFLLPYLSYPLLYISSANWFLLASLSLAAYEQVIRGNSVVVLEALDRIG